MEIFRGIEYQATGWRDPIGTPVFKKYTPRKLIWNLKMMGFFIGISSSRGSFSGSVLVFGGVSWDPAQKILQRVDSSWRLFVWALTIIFFPVWNQGLGRLHIKRAVASKNSVENPSLSYGLFDGQNEANNKITSPKNRNPGNAINCCSPKYLPKKKGIFLQHGKSRASNNGILGYVSFNSSKSRDPSPLPVPPPKEYVIMVPGFTKNKPLRMHGC